VGGCHEIQDIGIDRMFGFIGKFRKGMASLMLWLIIAIVIAAAVIVIIWFITGKLMGWDVSGIFKP
jgi:hypothetical protein